MEWYRMTALSLRTIVTVACEDEHGQDLLEYAMLVALIVLVAIGAIGTVGNNIHTLFWHAIATAFAAV
jgi:Flp pilus assembly pilin Flp